MEVDGGRPEATEPMNLPAAPYLPTEDPAVVASTPLSRAGWYDDAQHGGVVSALLARAVESTPTLVPMSVARLTVELFRPVPTVPLRTETTVIRQGKRVQVVQASAWSKDVEMARATALRMRDVDLDLPAEALPDEPPPPAPDTVPPVDRSTWGVGPRDGRIMFHRHAIDIREVEGSFRELGPASVWIRMTTPLVAGEAPSPLVRAVVAADFSNGVSRLLRSSDWVFMNADLTVSLHRLPEGAWIGLRSVSHLAPTGRGVAHSLLYDLTGPIGRGFQTLYIDRRSP